MNTRVLERTFDVYGFLRGRFPKGKLSGDNYVCNCPYCEDEGKLDKLWVLVRPVKGADGKLKPAGTWCCYYCSTGGVGAYSLLQYLEEGDKTAAFEILVTGSKADEENGYSVLRSAVLDALEVTGARDLDVDWTERLPPEMELPAGFRLYTEAEEKPVYFAERGITPKRAAYYQLGFCTSGYYANRLIVPVYFGDRRVFYLARYMRAKPPMGVKKTLYPPGCSPNRVLFNLERVRGQERVILVEDVFSAMALGDCAVATFGTTLSQYQLEQLLRLGCEEVVLLWDRDATVHHMEGLACPVRAAGKRCPDCGRYEKTWALAEMLSEFFTVRVPELPDARDPDEHSRPFLRALIEATPILGAQTDWASEVRARCGLL
jgi:hypothetical protein